jgi:hypothetical protein
MTAYEHRLIAWQLHLIADAIRGRYSPIIEGAGGVQIHVSLTTSDAPFTNPWSH